VILSGGGNEKERKERALSSGDEDPVRLGGGLVGGRQKEGGVWFPGNMGRSTEELR